MRSLDPSIPLSFIIIPLGRRANTTLLVTSTKGSLEYSPTRLLSFPNLTLNKSLNPIMSSTASRPILAPTARRSSR